MASQSENNSPQAYDRHRCMAGRKTAAWGRQSTISTMAWKETEKRASGLALITLFLFVGVLPAGAQTVELFVPVPNNRILEATPEQEGRIAQLRKQTTTKDLQLVRINVAALQGDKTTMTLSDEKKLNFSRQSIEKKDEKNFIWHGTIAELPATSTLVVHNGNITGTIQISRDLYHIEPVGGGVHAIVKIDTSKFPPEEPRSFKEKETLRPPDLDVRIRKLGLSAKDLHDSPVSISVIVAYTQSAKDSVTDIDATIQLAVSEANQAYANSGINIQLNLVGTFLFSYTETGKTFDTILSDFASNSDVNTQRNKAGADLAALIINQSDYCGLADAILANLCDAFAIVHYSCATGYYSFAHELGHLMGARHDENHDSTTTPFAYGHGYEHNSTTQPFRTVMAYACSTGNCEPRVQYFSNPNVNYTGVATGTAATNDNARVLNGTAGTIAAFWNPLADLAMTPGGDFTTRGFYVKNYPGNSLNKVRLYPMTRTPGSYTLTLTARGGAYNGTVIGTATATASLTNSNQPVDFVFASPTVTTGSTVTFQIGVTGPGSDVYYSVGPCLSDWKCTYPGTQVVETEGTSPPLDTDRRNSVGVQLFGCGSPAPPPPPPAGGGFIAVVILAALMATWTLARLWRHNRAASA